MMRKAVMVVAIGLAAGALAATPIFDAPVQAAAKKASKSGNCAPKRGRGWAPTQDMAKFQAWEIVAQTTGNWPIMTDTFKNERYKCKPDPAGYVCDSWIDVCKS
jgi:hypothetical protein